MNTNRTDSHPAPDGDADLLMQLRGLRGEQLPARDLWPGIAARIAQASHQAPDAARTVVPLRPGRARRLAPFALAASLVLAVGVAWQLRPGLGLPPADAGGAMLERQAQALTREYEGALRELQAAGAPVAPAGAALQELDRSAQQIRTALARDPDARFLLDQLRRTYDKRLELTQRATSS
jgi:hypothetical protein